MTTPQQTFHALKKTQKQILSGMFVAASLLFLTGCMIGKETTHKNCCDAIINSIR